MHTIFVYGTLLFPEVLSIVLDRQVTAAVYRPATLADFRRMQLVDIFPVIRRRPGDTVTGAVIHGISDAELRRLDFFESDLYVREQVEVVVDGAPALAFAYVDPRQGGEDNAREWDQEAFRVENLVSYLTDATHWMQKFR